jgi:hypothetical protein
VIESKECTKCKQEKILTEFHASKTHTGNVLSQCKVCQNSYAATWREQNPRKVQANNQYHSDLRTQLRHAKKVAA